MRLSGAVEQAWCIVILLAHPQLRSSVTNSSLAKQMAVSPTYIIKVTRKLVTAGLLSSVRGMGGGFRLAKPAQKISLRDIVEAIEGKDSFVCYQGVAERMFPHEPNEGINRGVNSITRAFDEAQEQWSQVLANTSLSDIIAEVTHD